MAISPYKLFWDWCFDKNIKSPIPEPGVLLKYNSPINAVFLLKSFIRIGKLNHYLNETVNNIGIRYIDSEELFIFIKKCVIDYKIQRRDIHYSTWKPKDKLFDKLRPKFPTFKSYDVELLVKIIQNKPIEERDSIYSALGIEKPQKEKLKKKVKAKKIGMKKFIDENFGVIKTLKKL